MNIFCHIGANARTAATALVAPATARLGVLLLGIVAVIASVAQAAPGPPAHRGSRAEAERLLSIVKPIGDFSIGNVSDDGYTLHLNDAGQWIGDLVIGFDSPGNDRPRVRSAHYTVKVFTVIASTAQLPILVRAADAIVAADGGPLQESEIEMIEQPSSELLTTGLLVLAIAVLLGIWRRGRVTLDIRKAHVIQSLVHTSIFAYWSIYWPGVGYQLPAILLMILLAYAADAAFSFARFGSWRAGLAPLPVVFSTNLFVWLDWRGAVLAMIGAFACKTYVQRNGRHIFNPSVAGLTLNAICTILFPGVVHFGGLFHTLNIAPNMAEWVFLGSLIPLTIFRLLPVSIGSIIGLFYLTQAPGALRPTLLLMMTLLATDPATTPRSDLGRLLFGLLVGGSYIVYRHLLQWLGQPDDFAKILSVPLANVLVPQFDAISNRIMTSTKRQWAAIWAQVAPQAGALAPRMERLGARLIPVPNSAFVAAWVLLFVFAINYEKPLDFEPTLHWTWGTPLVVRSAADGVPRCNDNPVFCTPFSFVQEVELWWRGIGVASTAAPQTASLQPRR